MEKLPKVGLYTQLIQKACKCDTAHAKRVEDEMRRVHGTLDHLTVPAFTRAARTAAEVLHTLDTTPGRDALEKLQYLMANRPN